MSLSKAHATAAAAVVATGLTFTPANNAEAAIFNYNIEAEYSFLQPQITDVSLYDSIVISGSIDTDGLFDAIAQPQRVQIDITDANILSGLVTTGGQSYATDDIITLGRTTPFTSIDNVIIFDTYDSNFSLNGEVISSFRCINNATISQSEADNVEDALMAIFANCTTFYGNSLGNPDFIAEAKNIVLSYESEDTTPATNVSGPGSTLPLAIFALGTGYVLSRRKGVESSSNNAVPATTLAV